MKKADFPTSEGYNAAAWLLRCDVAAIWAVGQVECGPEGAFFETGEPVVLFEPHVFDRLTGGKFRAERVPGIDGEAGVLSRATWKPGTYGPASIQHKRLAAAVALDRPAALKSASWGLFQILGENHERAGYGTIQRFVTAAYRSADDHLRMLVSFIRRDERLVDAIRVHDWTSFARVYNGPRFKEHGYDRRLAEAYEDFLNSPGLRAGSESGVDGRVPTAHREPGPREELR